MRKVLFSFFRFHSCIANRICFYTFAHAYTHIRREQLFILMLLVKCQNGESVKWKSFKTLSDAISNGKHVLRTEMASKVLHRVWEQAKKSVMHIGLKNFHANIECHFRVCGRGKKSIFMLKYLIWGHFLCGWQNFFLVKVT